MGIAAIALGLKLALGLTIDGQLTCPTRAQVASALAPILPEVFGPDLRLRLTRENEWSTGAPVSAIRLQLFTESGELLAEKRLHDTGECRILAHRIAAVAAAWQAELSDEPVRSRPAEAAEPEASDRLEPPPAQPTTVAKPVRSRVRVEMEGGAAYAPIGGTTVVFGLGGGAKWGLLGGQANVWFEAARSAHVGGVEEVGNFSRIAAELGPTLRLPFDQPQIELRAQGTFADVLADSSTFVDLGLDLGGRVFLGQGPVRGFLDLRLLLWPKYFGSTPSYQLSPTEVFLTVGVAFGGV